VVLPKPRKRTGEKAGYRRKKSFSVGKRRRSLRFFARRGGKEGFHAQKYGEGWEREGKGENSNPMILKKRRGGALLRAKGIRRGGKGEEGDFLPTGREVEKRRLKGIKYLGAN